MLLQKNRHRAGFTLIELAIVLGVAGLLIGGLWRLMSNGNLQMRDQATASQQAQLIGAINTYLQSSGQDVAAPITATTGGGQTFMGKLNAGASASIGLPSSQANAAGTNGCFSDANMALNPGLCNFLPPGFWSGTTNPYGQLYAVRVLKDSSAVGTAPQSYSFMILTNSGDTIPDTSGGRISSMIGGDGGFVYGSNVCNAANTSNACGAYGSWSVGLGTYGFAVPVAHAGVVASRTYYSPSQSLSDYWLARKQVPGDTTFVYNTMTVPQYMAGNDFYLGAWGTPAIPTTGGGALNAQGGVINMQTGAINMNDSSGIATGGGIMNVQGGNIFMQGDDVIGGGTLDLGVVGKIIGVGTGATAVDNPSIFLKGGMKTGSNPLFQLNSDCSIAPTVPPAMFFATCNPVAQISGDVNIIGLLKAYQLFAGTFIYQGSDERLKNNIKELSDPLTDVMKLRPVSFTYKASGQANMGVIAQDLEKIYPQLVTKGEDGMKAVSYDSLIAPLIGSVQELKKENDELRVQLKDMIKHQEQTDYELSKLKQK